MYTLLELGTHQLLQALHCRLHSLHGEEGGQVGGEGGQHQNNEEPISGDQDAPGQRLGRLPAALGGQRGEGEPEALLQVEVPASMPEDIRVVVVPQQNRVAKLAWQSYSFTELPWWSWSETTILF